MPTFKLTKRLIDDAKPKPREYTLWDSELRGLGAKVLPNGRKMYMLFYRTEDGTQRKPKLGEHGAITLEQARELARDMLGVVRGGGDPSSARQGARDGATVEEACKRFIKEHAALKKPRTMEQYEGILDKHVKPAWGTRKLASITRDDAVRLIHGVGKTHPIAANRVRAVLSVLFNLTERWGVRPNGSNPCDHIERYSEQKRHRDLTELELARLAKVLIEAEAEPEPDLEDEKKDVSEDPRAVAAIRLLLFTGCRRNEILRLRWSEVDVKRRMLRLGDSKTGAKVVHLNVAAKEVLEAQVKVDGNPYVFPGRKKGQPLRDIKGAWGRIRKRAKLEGNESIEAMRLHDLRHHFASTAAAAGLSLNTIGKLLGHKTPSTTARYAELADDPARRAAEEVGRMIAGALIPEADPVADGAA